MATVSISAEQQLDKQCALAMVPLGQHSADKCVWDATLNNCTRWCSKHIALWVNTMLKIIRDVQNGSSSPAALSLDRLNFMGQKGIFIRGDIKYLRELVTSGLSSQDESSNLLSMVSNHPLTNVSMVLIISGLTNNQDPKEQIPTDIIDRWEEQYNTAPGTTFEGKYNKIRQCITYTGHDRYTISGTKWPTPTIIDNAKAKEAITDIFTHTQGTYPTYHFSADLGQWPSSEIRGLQYALTQKTPCGTPLCRVECGSTHLVTYILENGGEATPSVACGGAHFSLLMTKTPSIAHWHSLVQMRINITNNGFVSVQWVMTW